MPIKTVIVVRHGETDFSAEGRYQGGLDTPFLSSRGIEQSQELCTCISTWKVGSVYCSSLKRARGTLDILRSSLPERCNINMTENMKEITISEWESKLKCDIQDQMPNSMMLWRYFPHLFRDASGNMPLISLYQRVCGFLAECKYLGDDPTLFVGHDHVNRSIISNLIGLPISIHHGIPQGLSSISILTKERQSYGFQINASNLAHKSGFCVPIENTPVPRIILIRHGITQANKDLLYQGSTDTPLTDEGREQICRAKTLLTEIGRPSLIVCSSLLRAFESACLLFDGYSINVDHRLDEFHYGHWQGMSVSDVEREFPNEVKAWHSLMSDNPISDGERISNLAGRVMSISAELIKAALPDRTVVVVAHDIIIRAIIALNMRLDIRHLWKFPISNSGITEMRLNPFQNWVLFRHNIMYGRLEERYGKRYF